MVPGTRAKVSQMLSALRSPRPSIWQDEVEVPQTKPFGKRCVWAIASLGSIERAATMPATPAFNRVRRRIADGSAADRALRVHINRVQRMARGHEQAVSLSPAEAEIGAALG